MLVNLYTLAVQVTKWNAFSSLNRPVAQAFDKEIIKVEKFVITGGKPLHGEVTISGAKMRLWVFCLLPFWQRMSA